VKAATRLDAPALSGAVASEGRGHPKGGVFSFRFDDNNARNFIVADSLEAHGMRGTFALNAYKSAPPDPALYLDTARVELWGRGHEIADHSAKHYFRTRLVAAKMRATLDSSYVRLDSLIGEKPRLFVSPVAQRQRRGLTPASAIRQKPR